MIRIILISILVSLISTSLALTLTKCETVQELRKQGFSENIIVDLICLIQHSSHYRTHVIRGTDNYGTYAYGLFQINDRQWCSSGPGPGKGCHIRCTDLLLDNITIAADCAKTILVQHGLNGWDTWRKNCRFYKLPAIDCYQSPVTKSIRYHNLIEKI